MLAQPWDRMSIESLLVSAARTREDRVFLRDCPRRPVWHGSPAEALDMPQFLARARFFARQLQALGLVAGDRVMLLLPNCIESYIATFGALLGGFVPAIAPVDEGPDFLRAAAERCGAAGIITLDRVAELAIAEKARMVAARVMSIRCVAGFGSDLPDGIVPLDGWADDDVPPAAQMPEQEQDAPALITFSRDASGVVAALRSQGQVLAEMLALAAACRLDGTSRLVTLLHPGAAATFIAGALFPLFAGAEVQLIGPFDRRALADAVGQEGRCVVLGPAPVVSALASAEGGQSHPPHLGLIGLQHAEGSPFRFAQKGALPAALIVDFHEEAMVAFGKWPDVADCALAGPQAHPMAGALPEGLLWLDFAPGENGRSSIEGAGAALLMRRAEATTRAA